MTFKKTLVAAAHAAGRFQLKHFGKLGHVTRHFKAHHEMVTYVDKQSEHKIIGIIKKQFPGHAIISEESPMQKHIRGEFTWVIDPLDGTTNFAIGNPLFGVSIGIIDVRGAYEGVLYFPVMRRLLYCRRGHGAYENGRLVHVSRSGLADSILSVNFSHNIQASRQAMGIMKQLRPCVNNIRIFGSSAFAFSLVANGAVDGLIMVGTQHHWDVHPGILMATEAGGKVTNFSGKTWDINGRGIIISNGKIHSNLVRELR
ncbi:MAG: inositol monophosphatase [Patescibacteria group bacterium]